MLTSRVQAAGVVSAVLFVCATAEAAVLDPRYGAGVELQNLGTTLYEGQNSAGGSVATGPGGAVITEGSAAFSDSPPSHVNTTSIPGRGVIARAYLFDRLVFSVAGGGSAEVPVRMSGHWNGAGGSMVDYNLFVGPTNYGGRASPTGYSESHVNGAPVASTFTFESGDFVTGVVGSYQVNARLNVTDGGAYDIFAQVRAQASEGASAYMDDPITITLPAGVTFTAASGSTYVVPEPSALLLIGFGFAALVRRRSHRSGGRPNRPLA